MLSPDERQIIEQWELDLEVMAYNFLEMINDYHWSPQKAWLHFTTKDHGHLTEPQKLKLWLKILAQIEKSIQAIGIERIMESK